MLLPVLLAVAGGVLIIVGQLDLDPQPASSLPPIEDPTPTPVAVATATPSSGETPAPTPRPTPIPPNWHAVQLQIDSVGINVRVRKSTSGSTDDFPTDDAAFILQNSSQPGRGTNSYIFAHAISTLFKPLWNVQLGARIKVLMSDGVVLRYVVTEVHPNVSCPDDRAAPHPNPPLALQLAKPGCDEGAAWTQPTDHERLTLQTSQGYNRNYGELVVVADPIS
jgi:sortase family protein